MKQKVKSIGAISAIDLKGVTVSTCPGRLSVMLSFVDGSCCTRV